MLARLRAVAAASDHATVTSCVLEGEIPAARVHDLQQRLPALTRGEGVLESRLRPLPAGARARRRRPRTDHNPLDRKEYLLHVLRRV